MKSCTIQTKEAYVKFRDTGVLRADNNFIWDDYAFQYNWMVEQMKKRISAPPIVYIEYPIWAWYSGVVLTRRGLT